jgi:hypothetical protein
MARAASAWLLPAPQGVRLHEIPARCREAGAEQQLRRPSDQKKNRLSAAGAGERQEERMRPAPRGLAAVVSIPFQHLPMGRAALI